MKLEPRLAQPFLNVELSSSLTSSSPEGWWCFLLSPSLCHSLDPPIFPPFLQLLNLCLLGLGILSLLAFGTVPSVICIISVYKLGINSDFFQDWWLLSRSLFSSLRSYWWTVFGTFFLLSNTWHGGSRLNDDVSPIDAVQWRGVRLSSRPCCLESACPSNWDVLMRLNAPLCSITHFLSFVPCNTLAVVWTFAQVPSSLHPSFLLSVKSIICFNSWNMHHARLFSSHQLAKKAYHMLI